MLAAILALGDMMVHECRLQDIVHMDACTLKGHLLQASPWQWVALFCIAEVTRLSNQSRTVQVLFLAGQPSAAAHLVC